MRCVQKRIPHKKTSDLASFDLVQNFLRFNENIYEKSQFVSSKKPFPQFFKLKLYPKVKIDMPSVFPDLKYMDIATKSIRISLKL